MLFSSISFLYYFLPIVFLIYFISPKKLKNVVLLISSLVFYGSGEPRYIYVMLVNIFVNYFGGIILDNLKKYKNIRKIVFFFLVLFNIGMLGYFKYANFFIENFSRLFGISTVVMNIVLPIGISFYTFQILSYIIDVYRENVVAQKNPIILGTYITLFPQLIAGPIVRYTDVEKQLLYREHSFDKIFDGIRRFVMGLGKKVLLANVLGEFCNSFYLTNEKSVLLYWLFAIVYTLQIYFDFSGYSDMAIGLGKIFGFDFCENFNYPFISKSISEFWRRWHMSLGTWFKDYVYIPMGGSKCSKTRMFFNILTVWFLTGFWHGAEWNFIIWGLYFALFLLLEKLLLAKYLEKSKILSHFYVMFFILISFVIFNGTDLNELFVSVKSMFGLNNIPFICETFVYQFRNYSFIVLISLLISTPLFSRLKDFYLKKSNDKKLRIFDIVEICYLFVLLIVSTGYLVDGSFNPFLYFRF